MRGGEKGGGEGDVGAGGTRRVLYREYGERALLLKGEKVLLNWSYVQSPPVCLVLSVYQYYPA